MDLKLKARRNGEAKRRAEVRDKPIEPGDLEKLFTAPVTDDKIKKLISLFQSRLNEAWSRNFKEARVWAATDQAYDIAFEQMTPTMVRHVMSRAFARPGISQEQRLAELERQRAVWDLAEESIFTCVRSADGKVERDVRAETFTEVRIPLVKAYTTIRWAKLFNDRNNYPFFSYQPVHLTEINRMQCEIITNLIQQMSSQYGYSSKLKQIILQTLLYGVTMMFPKEVWHCEMAEDANGEEYCAKEGIRYDVPHPSQIGWDRTCPLDSFNTDTGCNWALYWNVLKYGEIQNNERYWNKDKISIGSTNWFDPTYSYGYFSEFYPCTLRSPWEGRHMDKRRERELEYYTTADEDKAVFLTQLFAKLRPSEWGLGSSKTESWFRFVLANDYTVVWAEQFRRYRPVLCCTYDPDQNRARNASFSLEIVPWQDELGNLLTQIMLSIKQNALKIIPYDIDQLPKSELQKILNETRKVSGIIFWPFSGREVRNARQQDIGKLFNTVDFPLQNTAEQTTNISTMLTIMERLLQISAQEAGASAVHIETAEEVRTKSVNTSSRVDLTGAGIDEFIDAWKKQIYDAYQGYADEEFVSQVSGATPESLKELEKMGFELGDTFEMKTEVRGKKSKLSIEAFISSRENATRINQPAVAQIVFQYMQQVGPLLLQQISDLDVRHQVLRQMVGIANRAAKMAGVPTDDLVTVPPMPAKSNEANSGGAREYLNFNFKDLPEDTKQYALQSIGLPPSRLPAAPPPGQAPAAGGQAPSGPGDQLLQVAGQIKEAAVQQVAQELKPVLQEQEQGKQQLDQTTELALRQKQQIEQLQAIFAQMQQIFGQAAAAPPAPQPVLPQA